MRVGSMTDCFPHGVKAVPHGWPVKTLNMARNSKAHIKVCSIGNFTFSLMFPVFKLRVEQL